jgi:hypothetical protein
MPLDVNARKEEHLEGLQFIPVQGLRRNQALQFDFFSPITNAGSYVTVEKANPIRGRKVMIRLWIVVSGFKWMIADFTVHFTAGLCLPRTLQNNT